LNSVNRRIVSSYLLPHSQAFVCGINGNDTSSNSQNEYPDRAGYPYIVVGSESSSGKIIGCEYATVLDGSEERFRLSLIETSMNLGCDVVFTMIDVK